MNAVFWLVAAVVVLSSVWVAVDAARHRVPTFGEHYDINTGAVAWFLGCILFWIFVFPAYLVRRAAVLRDRAAQRLRDDDDLPVPPAQVPRLQEAPPSADQGDWITERPVSAAPITRPADDPDADMVDIRIVRSTGGEFCAVLALLVPLFAAAAEFVVRDMPIALGFAIGCATVVATAVLLGIDAAQLGPVDQTGRRRGTSGILAGVILLWVVFYPVAFFRRRHFGRPNFGVLAILVAVVFMGAPLIKDGANLATLLTGDPPACTSPEVTQLVESLIRRNNPMLGITKVDGFRETRFDRNAMIRHGQCTIHQPNGALQVTYQVKWLDRSKGQFSVFVEGGNPAPPNAGPR
jgi:hypothetical protein